MNSWEGLRAGYSASKRRGRGGRPRANGSSDPTPDEIAVVQRLADGVPYNEVHGGDSRLRYHLMQAFRKLGPLDDAQRRGAGAYVVAEAFRRGLIK